VADRGESSTGRSGLTDPSVRDSLSRSASRSPDWDLGPFAQVILAQLDADLPVGIVRLVPGLLPVLWS
jgi:hypothetical protein